MDENNKSNDLIAGGSIGYYRLIEKIGSGGMGEVYLALDTKLNRNVAIKVLLSDFFNDPDKIARFKREAKTAASINHANIMGIYDIDEAVLDSGQKINFIVMEYIEGNPLDKFLISGTQKPTSELLRIAEKLASGLAAAHKMGVVHRDIKMGNIIINKDNVPKILDFGLAKPIDPISINKKPEEITEDTESVVNDLTQEGKIVGTISYMSPEQARGVSVDLRSDIFSLGVLLYKIFTGKFPFEGSDNVSIIAKILEAPHNPLRQVTKNLPAELERIINKCLQKKPDDRYQDTRDLMIDLRNLRKQFDSGVTDSVSGLYDYTNSQKQVSSIKKNIFLSSAFAFVIVLLAIYFVDPFNIFNSNAMAKTNSLAILNFENLSDPDDIDRLGQILQELLITDLSENNRMKVVSSQRLFDIQKKLGYESNNKIDRSMAAEVAKKSGAGTMLSGNLINTGQEWLVTGQLIDVKKGTVIKSHRLKGPDLYTMVDSLSNFILSDLSVTQELSSDEQSTEKKKTISMDGYRHYFSGIDYLGDTDYKNAIKEFTKAIEIDQSFSKAYYKLTIALWWLDDLSELEKSHEIINLIRERKYASKHDELLVKAAFALFEREYNVAKIAYQELAILYPDDKEVWYGLGEALFHADNNSKRESLDAFEKAINLDASFVLAYRHVFELYATYEKFEKAYQTAQALVKEKPESLMSYRYLASTSILLKDSVKIQESEKEALKHHKTEDDLLALYTELINAYGKIQNFTKAGEYCNKAFEINKTNSSRYLSNIWDIMIRYNESVNRNKIVDSILNVVIESKVPVFQKMNLIINKIQRDFTNVHTRQKAHELLERGFELDSTNSYANLYAVAAQLALVERKYNISEKYANRSIEISKDVKNNWATNVLFQSVLFSKNYKRAEKLAINALKEENNIAIDYLKLLKVFIYSGQLEKADSLINFATDKDTSISRQSLFLTSAATAYKNIEQLDKALKYLSTSIVLNPDDYNTIDVLARTLITNGDYSEGEIYARMLLKDETNLEPGFMDLTRCFLIQKNYNKAMEWLSKLDISNSSSLRMYGYYYSTLKQFDSAFYYADSAFKLNQQFFSMNLVAWVKIAGDIDIDGGIQMAIDAINSPLAYNYFDIYIYESPFVPLPQHTLGLGYYKKSDFEHAIKYLEQASKLRPNDIQIRSDLNKCLEKMKS